MNLKLPDVEYAFRANIFYRLLLDSMNNRRKSSDNQKGRFDKPTGTQMFQDLNDLIDTNQHSLAGINSQKNLDRSLKNAASRFKQGTHGTRKSVITLLNDNDYAAEFDEQIKHNYQTAFIKAIEFVQRYFGEVNTNRNTALVQKTLYLILNDNSISEDQVFYICPDGTPRTKSNFKDLKEIDLASFILGVWHYLIASGRFQTDLKEVDTIIVDPQYETLSFKLTCSDADKVQHSLESANAESEGTVKRSYNPRKIVKRIKSKGRSYVAAEDEFPSRCDLQKLVNYYELDEEIDIIAILEKNDIVLSRGIFFYLLAENIEVVNPKRKKHAVERLFLALMNLTKENSCEIDYKKSYVEYIHDKFKYLKSVTSADFLDDRNCIQQFMHSNAYDRLCDMIKIREKFFNSANKNEALVVELIEFIRNDDSIPNNLNFMINSQWETVTKKDLGEIEELEFEPFLLSVWFHVVSRLNTKDNADKRTFDMVFKVNYENMGKECEIYRPAHIINDQSDLCVDLIYLDASRLDEGEVDQ